MDGRGFDDLVKAVANGTSRRGLLRGGLALAAGAFGVRISATNGAAALARRPGETCRGNGDCASGVCSQPDRTGRRRCLCTAPTDCPQGSNSCTTVTCSSEGICASVTNTGASCDTGNLCVVNGTCDARGRCVGTPVTCAASDQCHDPGVCDARTGTCSNPPKPNGAPCEDGNACSTGDTCQGGFCTSGTWTVCQPFGPCQSASFCDSITGECRPVNTTNGTPCSDPANCIPEGVCRDGSCYGVHNCPVCHFCAGGTCSALPALGPLFDSRCEGGMCCNGACVDLSSDDDNCGTCYFSCVSSSSCQNGVCQGPGCLTPLSCGVQGNPF